MMRAVSTYVALGDSFTCGTSPELGRWPDGVARSFGPDVRYENLATIGATSRRVEEEQLEPGLALRPDLVSLICGANDVLESVRPDPGAFADRLERMFARIRAGSPSAAIVTATYPDLSLFLDLRPRTKRRVRRGMAGFNDVCREVARRNGVLLLDWADHPASGEPVNRASDGFHPSPEGHRRAAQEVIQALRREEVA